MYCASPDQRLFSSVHTGILEDQCNAHDASDLPLLVVHLDCDVREFDCFTLLTSILQASSKYSRTMKHIALFNQLHFTGIIGLLGILNRCRTILLFSSQRSPNYPFSVAT